MSTEFANYQPEAWQEDGLLVRLRLAKPGKARRTGAWPAVVALSLQACAVPGAHRVTGTGALLGPPVVGREAFAPDRADLLRQQKNDIDAVDPDYWTRLTKSLSMLPTLPDESDGPDFDPFI